ARADADADLAGARLGIGQVAQHQARSRPLETHDFHGSRPSAPRWRRFADAESDSGLIDADALRLRLRRLRNRDLQHAIAHAGVDGVHIHRPRQRERTFEAAVAALDQPIGLLFFLAL